MNNLISASLTNETVVAAKAKIDETKALMPFLQALPASQKKRNRVMGQKSVEYVNLGLRGADNFGQYLPQTFNSEEFRNDSLLVSQLWEVRVPLAALLESIDDTIFAAAADALKTADEVYGYLKVAARKDASVKALVEEMSKRYARQPVAKQEKPADNAR